MVDFIVQIKNVESNQCLDSLNRPISEGIGTFKCHGGDGNQLFVYYKEKLFRGPTNCLHADVLTNYVNLVSCDESKMNIYWFYDKMVGFIKIHQFTEIWIRN